MSNRRVLAICSDRQQRQRLLASLERAGAEVDVVARGDEVDPLGYRYAFIATAGDRARDVEDVQRIADGLHDRCHAAVIAPKAQLADLIAFLGDPRVNHVIVGDELERGVEITARKLLTGDIFGAEKYLPEGADVRVLRLRDFEGRGRAIDSVLDYAEEVRMRRQVRTAIGQVCEELLMNALYDAPVDDSGHQVFSEVDPHERTRARSPRPVSIRYAATDQSFVIAVRDRFGRLAKNTILSYIDKCLHSPDQIDRKTYGAGLGLYLVANAAASYIVNVAFGIATEVVCTFDRGAKAPLRQVGVFVHPGGAEHLREGPTAAMAAAYGPDGPDGLDGSDDPRGNRG